MMHMTPGWSHKGWQWAGPLGWWDTDRWVMQRELGYQVYLGGGKKKREREKEKKEGDREEGGETEAAFLEER